MSNENVGPHARRSILAFLVSLFMAPAPGQTPTGAITANEIDILAFSFKGFLEIWMSIKDQTLEIRADGRSVKMTLKQMMDELEGTDGKG